ncbi:reverse transcriptase domain-containing protein [Tanacetum coccineum]
MVKKHDDNWRMCVGFKDLNKACPKDGYPLPKIDWKVESLCRYPFKCFLDANKGYHQIKMAKENEEKTAFITSLGIFCYLKMPLCLKNAGETYQRLVDKAFQKKIGRNLEVYVDDLVIKSRTEQEIIRDIEETFKTLKEVNMKLNPKKCTFRVEEGIRAKAKRNVSKPKQIPVQISKKVATILQNFEEMHEKSDFQWTAEAKAAFKQMKKLIAELPTLTAHMEKEELIVYLTAAREAPIKQVLSKPEIVGRLQKLSIELGEYDIQYMPKISVKGKILADFIVERPKDDSLAAPMEVEEELSDLCTLFTDGSSCIDGSRAGLILTNPEGTGFTYALRFRFDATNNEAKYKALIADLKIAEQMGVKNLQTHVDSRLVANQINGSYIAKEPVEELKEKSINEAEVLTIVEEEGNTWMTPIYEYLTKKHSPRKAKRQGWYDLNQDGSYMWLNPFGCAKLTTFVVMCKAYGCEPSVDLFRWFFNLCRAGKWLTFAKSVHVFPDPVLFLAGLKPLWEHGQQRPAIMTGGKDVDFMNFIYTKDDEDLSFLPKEPSSGFGTGSPSISVNTEPLKADEDLVIQPTKVTKDSRESLKPEVFVVHPGSVAAQIKDRKYKTRGGSSRPPIKRKLAPMSSTSHATRAKTSSLKDDVPFLTVSDDDEGLPDVLEFKDATACHLKISAITSLAYKNHLDNHIDVIKKLRGEFDVIKDIERAREEECEELQAKFKEHKVSLDIMMLESQKWAIYQQSLSTLESKVTSLEAKKARLEAVEVSLRKEVEELKHDRLVSSVILYGRCRAYEQVADMKEPFDLSKVKGYHSFYKKDHIQARNDLAIATFPLLDEFMADPSASIEALLSKKPPSLQRPAPSRTQVPLPSSQRATPSSVPVSNLMSPPLDVSVVKPNPLNFNEGHHVGVNSVLRVACTL